MYQIKRSRDFAEIQCERPPPESAGQFQFSAILIITKPGLHKAVISLSDVTVMTSNEEFMNMHFVYDSMQWQCECYS